MPESTDLDDDAKVALIRDGYDRIAGDYLRLARDAPESHPRREMSSAFLARLPPGGAASILEVGCGAGVPVAAEVLRQGHAYVGVDVSPRQIELARTHLPHGDFRLGDVLDEAFDDETFDGVIALYVITHVPREKWAHLLAHLHRWLKPGGKLLVNAPPSDSPGWLEEDFLGFGGSSWTNGYPLERTLDLLGAQGLTVLDATPRDEGDDKPERWVWITAEKASRQLR